MLKRLFCGIEEPFELSTFIFRSVCGYVVNINGTFVLNTNTKFFKTMKTAAVLLYLSLALQLTKTVKTLLFWILNRRQITPKHIPWHPCVVIMVVLNFKIFKLFSVGVGKKV